MEFSRFLIGWLNWVRKSKACKIQKSSPLPIKVKNKNMIWRIFCFLKIVYIWNNLTHTSIEEFITFPKEGEAAVTWFSSIVWCCSCRPLPPKPTPIAEAKLGGVAELPNAVGGVIVLCMFVDEIFWKKRNNLLIYKANGNFRRRVDYYINYNSWNI